MVEVAQSQSRESFHHPFVADNVHLSMKSGLVQVVGTTGVR